MTKLLDASRELDVKSLVVGKLPADIEPSKDLGPEPQFMWGEKHSLYVDPKYQRAADTSASRKLIIKIVEGFSWEKFQPITVARMSDGSGRFMVIDGQHRAIAALAHPGVTHVPMWVKDGGDVKGDAKTFVAVNNDRVAMSVLQIFRARLTAGDPDAAQLAKVCDRAGVKVATNIQPGVGIAARQTVAISTIRDIIAKDGEKLAERALTVLAKAHPKTPDQFRAAVIKAVATILRTQKKADEARLIRVLAAHDCKQIQDAARRVRKDLGGSTVSNIVSVIRKAYNKGLIPANQLRDAL